MMLMVLLMLIHWPSLRVAFAMLLVLHAAWLILFCANEIIGIAG
jgi:hypothetical protein